MLCLLLEACDVGRENAFPLAFCDGGVCVCVKYVAHVQTVITNAFTFP